ncbi:helix-turn-helix domain-containing protein [Variovorax sp. J22R133]|uniref:TetR/AcrR family transcriptional regulator n=1 Tax=Variovorax brevis TaxID=3053503 RepID=UPI00257891D0|nr:TetR/AcrR family transcriptional regulator [Variovorax sp. J22R133]MDM0117436.1 helix-turn-helix domain-containing protein [Variovorax sp. J22R133]
MTRAKPSGSDIVRIEVPAQPRKRPRQTRSVALVEALKQSGREILDGEGRDALTVQNLSERSGVAVSSIYEYFPTMESLIAAIFNDYRRDARREVVEHIAALPPSAGLFEGIVSLLRFGLAALERWAQVDPEFNLKATYYEELVRLELVKSEHFWSAVAMPALMEKFADEVLVRDREKAAFLAHHVLLAIPRAIVLGRPQYLGEPDTPVLIARMLHALLTTPGESRDSLRGAAPDTTAA